MRYFFRGIIRETGKPAEGHVEALTEEEGYELLSQSGIVTESLKPDPKSLNLSKEQTQFDSAIDSALDLSSAQIPFDRLAERYKGKSVWVIDRDKIRGRVAQVVDQILAQSTDQSESMTQTRERVADAIKGLFEDNRNIATQASASTIALEQQISRLTGVVKQIERTMGALMTAVRNIGAGGYGGGGVPRRYSMSAPAAARGNEEVLLEIFQNNVDLLRSLEERAAVGAAPPAPPITVNPQPATAGPA